jgi:hypothetical protein
MVLVENLLRIAAARSWSSVSFLIAIGMGSPEIIASIARRLSDQRLVRTASAIQSPPVNLRKLGKSPAHTEPNR